MRMTSGLLYNNKVKYIRLLNSLLYYEQNNINELMASGLPSFPTSVTTFTKK